LGEFGSIIHATLDFCRILHEWGNFLASDAHSKPYRGSEADDSAYLKQIGERVRAARARRGMTRKILANDSGVSERYLAQLESGQGNVSILLLRDVARALDMPIEALILDGPDPSTDLVHTVEFLRRLPPSGLLEARQVLLSRFGGNDISARCGRIALIGLRGAGKSTLGARLAEGSALEFFELDRMIEERAGIPLSSIFDLYGQSGFRRLERQCLEELLEGHLSFVVATGGSLVSETATFERLLTACFTVWLHAAPELHMQRVIEQGDMRPMADNREAMADLRRILEVREPLYRRAEFAIDTGVNSLEACVREIQAAVAKKLAPQGAGAD